MINFKKDMIGKQWIILSVGEYGPELPTKDYNMKHLRLAEVDSDFRAIGNFLYPKQNEAPQENDLIEFHQDLSGVYVFIKTGTYDPEERNNRPGGSIRW